MGGSGVAAGFNGADPLRLSPCDREGAEMANQASAPFKETGYQLTEVRAATKSEIEELAVGSSTPVVGMDRTGNV